MYVEGDDPYFSFPHTLIYCLSVLTPSRCIIRYSSLIKTLYSSWKQEPFPLYADRINREICLLYQEQGMTKTVVDRTGWAGGEGPFHEEQDCLFRGPVPFSASQQIHLHRHQLYLLRNEQRERYLCALFLLGKVI
jgi:hypothetical protein